jgi:hypothetical protein
VFTSSDSGHWGFSGPTYIQAMSTAQVSMAGQKELLPELPLGLSGPGSLWALPHSGLSLGLSCLSPGTAW